MQIAKSYLGIGRRIESDFILLTPPYDAGQKRHRALEMDPPFPPQEFPEALVSG